MEPIVVAAVAKTVVDLGAQRVQRHATLAIPLATAHLSAAQTAGHWIPEDALGTALAGSGLNSLAHSATEGNAAHQLLGHGLSDQLGVELGALDLDDLDADGAVGNLLQLLARRIDLSAPSCRSQRPGGRS